jgi:hypothetical protein
VSEDTLHDNDTDNDKPVTPTDGDELHIGISQPCSVAAINSSQAQAPAVFPGLAVAPAAVQRRNSLLGRLKRIAIVAGRKNRKSPSPSQSQAPFSP